MNSSRRLYKLSPITNFMKNYIVYHFNVDDTNNDNALICMIGILNFILIKKDHSKLHTDAYNQIKITDTLFFPSRCPRVW